MSGGARGTGARRNDVDDRAAVRGDDGIDDALDDPRLCDDNDDDDENAFAIAKTDEDVRRWRRRGRWPLRAAKRDRVVANIDIDIGISSTTMKWRLIVLASAAFMGGGEAGTDPAHPCHCRERGRPGVRQRQW